MKKVLVILIIVTVFTFIFAQPVSADTRLYAGNLRNSAYGVQATISTPSSKPYLESGAHESNWIGPNTSYWVQTGWITWPSISNAHSYVEVVWTGLRFYQEYDIQNWGTDRQYKVQYEFGWAAYIGGVWKGMWGGGGLPNPPVQVAGLSEVHNSSYSTLDTWFKYIQWKNSSGTYNNFDQSLWVEQGTYHVQKNFLWYYKTYGPQ